MRKILCLFISLMLLSFIPHIATAEFKKTKIAVLDFQLQGEDFQTEDMGIIVAEWLITALVQEGRFDVIERRLLEKIIQEQKLTMTGIVDQKSATKLGKLLGVKVIISGSVLKLQNSLEVNARIIDVESASIIAAESVQGSSASSLEELIGQMAKKISKDFPLEGYVVHRDGNAITLDLGKRAGVKLGMRFIVFREGNIIKHPKTGEILDIEKNETGLIEVTSVLDKISKAVIVEEKEPGAIKYSQMIKSDLEWVATRPKSEPVLTKSNQGRLYINTEPKNARVRILNINPKYVQGMKLDSGSYHVEVSAPGYGKKSEWIILKEGEEKTIFTQIEKSSAQKPAPVSAPAPAPKMVEENPQVLRLIEMLQSSDPIYKRSAAKNIYKSYRHHPGVLEAVNTELLNGYKKNAGNKYYVDAMSWLKKYGLKNARKYE
jgi:TolB-like protein